MSRHGEDGSDGLDAYLVACRAGFKGTVQDWLSSLKGEKGERGVDGQDGKDGADGKDAEPVSLDVLLKLVVSQVDKIPRPKDGRDGLNGKQGPRGEAGSNGWTPIPAIVSDGERRVYQIVRWVGGSGDAPESGWYIGSDGPVREIARAVDIRGPVGRDGRSGGMITSQSNAPSGIVTIPEVSSDPTAPGAGQTWVLYTAAEPAGTLSALFGAYPIVTDAEAPESFLLSYKSSAGIKRVALT